METDTNQFFSWRGSAGSNLNLIAFAAYLKVCKIQMRKAAELKQAPINLFHEGILLIQDSSQIDW